MRKDDHLSHRRFLSESFGNRPFSLMIERCDRIIENDGCAGGIEIHLSEKIRQGQGALLPLTENVIRLVATFGFETAKSLPSAPPRLELKRQ
jgi:hypothetical protein